METKPKRTISGSDWLIVPTANYNLITNFLHEAKTFSEVYAYVAPEGTCKSEALKKFSASYANVMLLSCEEHWSKREFLTRLLRAMGQSADGLRTSDMMDAIEMAATNMPANPIIILDELDKVRDELLYFFITLYNRLEGKCGIFICSTPYLKRRVERGIQLNKKGFAEFFSRMGRRFIEGHKPAAQDIVAIAKANGVTKETDLQKIVENCDGDLRRVKRLVCAIKRKENLKTKPT